MEDPGLLLLHILHAVRRGCGIFSPDHCWDLAGSLAGRVSLSTGNKKRQSHISGLYGEGVSFTLDLLSLFTVSKLVESPSAQKSQLKPVRGSAGHKECMCEQDTTSATSWLAAFSAWGELSKTTKQEKTRLAEEPHNYSDRVPEEASL